LAIGKFPFVFPFLFFFFFSVPTVSLFLSPFPLRPPSFSFFRSPFSASSSFFHISEQSQPAQVISLSITHSVTQLRTNPFFLRSILRPALSAILLKKCGRDSANFQIAVFSAQSGVGLSFAPTIFVIGLPLGLVNGILNSFSCLTSGDRFTPSLLWG
jgi:hypothetical protein